MKSLLAIDPSLSSSGYSKISLESREILLCNRITTKNDREENYRIVDIVKYLSNIVMQDEEVQYIVMEDGFIGRMASVKTGLTLCKLRGGIITHFMMQGIPVYTYPPKEIRKNLGLSGNAKKEEVAEYILSLYPELIDTVGPYSDKANKQKTSDMYDSVSIGLSHLIKCGSWFDNGDGYRHWIRKLWWRI